MPEFNYAKGRIVESINFIFEEIGELESDYSAVTWKDYREDKKTQKQTSLSKIAIQRNRLAHRYLDFRWQAVQMFKQQKDLIVALTTRILDREEKK